jgi:hypothetical protein
VIGLEQVERLLADASNSLASLLRISFDEILHEQSNITTPITKRRDLNRNDIETVEQVCAEDPVPDSCGEVSVRRRQHSDIDDDRRVSPHTFELPLLKHSQQGDLRFGEALRLHPERWSRRRLTRTDRGVAAALR